MTFYTDQQKRIRYHAQPSDTANIHGADDPIEADNFVEWASAEIEDHYPGYVVEIARAESSVVGVTNDSARASEIAAFLGELPARYWALMCPGRVVSACRLPIKVI